MLANLMSAIAEQYRVEGLRLNENGVCKMLVDGKLEIRIEDGPTDQLAHIYCRIARAPEFQVRAFYETFLATQFFGKEVGMGCSFGLSKETGEVFLNRTIEPEGMTGEDFVEVPASSSTERITGPSSLRRRDRLHTPPGLPRKPMK